MTCFVVISHYTYDGFDRLKDTIFPDASYETRSYDNNDNEKTLLMRNGKLFEHFYDSTNRRQSTQIEGEAPITFDYDALGRIETTVRANSQISHLYDELGRIEQTITNGRTLSYGYNLAGLRTSLVHPDGIEVGYEYDAPAMLSRITLSGVGTLVTYQYNEIGQLGQILRGNGVNTSVVSDSLGKVDSIEHHGFNTSTFEYNPASQIIGRTVSDLNFQTKAPNRGETSYDVNELNQYTLVDGEAPQYDLNGNLTSFDGWVYDYNAHNRLISATSAGQDLILSYDALGTLSSTVISGSTTQYLYDNDELIGEYDGNNNLLRRYVHGIGVDDPLVWFEGAGTNEVKYLLADEKSSIVLETDINGQAVTRHDYSAYGEPMNDSPSRFRYTGQTLIPGTELYYYKARIYHPKLGRFLQTDPIGYEDQMNLYAYVHNDPINLIDPTGEATVILKEATKQAAKKQAQQQAKDQAKKQSRKQVAKNKPSKTEVSKTKDGSPRIKQEFKDGRKTDITDKRVKEWKPNAHPKAPKGAMQKIKFKDAQKGSKGYKRNPTELEKQLLDEVRDIDL